MMEASPYWQVRYFEDGRTFKRSTRFQQVGPQGGKQPNFATVADWKPLPPTTKPGHGWVPVKTTPNSNR